MVDEEGDNNLEMGENLEGSDEEPDENIIEGGVNNFQKEFTIFFKETKSHLIIFPSLPEEKKLLDSKIEKKEWILECERVSSKLKFVVKSDAKEWRSHIESTKTYSENIKKIVPDSRACMEKIAEELGKVLERIGKRERNINVNMNEIV